MLFAGNFSEHLEWESDEDRECRFVFIGRNLKKEELIKGIKDCAAEPLRFKEGDEVMYYNDRAYRMGTGQAEFVPGKILQCWFEGDPYLIELKDGTKVRVPIDASEMVKKME